MRLRTCALGNREPLDHDVEIKFEPEKAWWAPIKQGDLPWVAIAAQKDQENTSQSVSRVSRPANYILASA